MKKVKRSKLLKFMSLTLAVVIVTGSVIGYNRFESSANAENDANTKSEIEMVESAEVEASEEYSVTENNIDASKYMDYVRFNENNKAFEITREGYECISKEELIQVEQVMAKTNETLKYIDINSEDVTIVDCDNYKDIEEKITRKKYKEGKNDIKIDFHLVTVKLSKTTVNTIGAGVTIAGIWVTKGLVANVLGTLGTGVGICPGGIWFKVSLLSLVPPLRLVAGIAFTRAGFQ